MKSLSTSSLVGFSISFNFSLILEALEKVNKTVEYVEFDKKKLTGTYVRYPERSELPADIKESMIVEFYSK